jgi:hypothetical protein
MAVCPDLQFDGCCSGGSGVSCSGEEKGEEGNDFDTHGHNDRYGDEDGDDTMI